MSEVPNNRLFVGNLSNSTTDQDLQDAFKDAGAIKQSGIVTRGRLSLGYGFIDFVNAASVNDTIAKFKDLKIQDREVSFEVAKDASFQCEYSQVKKRERKPRAEGSDTQGQFTGNNTNQANQDGQDGDNVPQRRARPQRRRNRNRNTGGTGVPENDGQNLNNYRGNGNQQGNFQGQGNNNSFNSGNNNFGDNAGQRPRNPRRRNNRDEQGSQQQGQGQQQPRPPREPRQPREPRPPREKIPSTTTLHVANLPYSFDDNNLGGLFKEFNVVSSRVVIAKNGKPRGYGFVEFANESEQLRALNAKNNLSIPDGNETKTLTLSISHTPANTTTTQ